MILLTSCRRLRINIVPERLTAIIPITDNVMFKSFGPVDGTVSDGPVFGAVVGAGVVVGLGVAAGAGFGVVVVPRLSLLVLFVSVFWVLVSVLGALATSTGRECDALN